MERLTKINKLGNPVLLSPVECARCGETDGSPVNERGEDIAQRLAAYEGTGMTPEEITGLENQLDTMCAIFKANFNDRAELEQERRWIPVAERLPKPGERVIADWGMIGEAYLGQDGIWYRNELNIREFFKAKVTHWMPLPEGLKGVRET